MKKILLLGSGELGKEFVIACKRLGQYVIAVDNYNNAPAMQVADQFEIIDMLDGNQLDQVVAKHSPDIIVPEIEAIRTEKLFAYEQKGIQVVPSAKATNFTMNRRAVRDLAVTELGLPTAKYAYASTLEEFHTAVESIGIPCVVKPLMSSSGKGQSYIKSQAQVQSSWDFALAGSRGDIVEVIVEEFIDFDFEITLLTVTQIEGPTLFCPPIGHSQERGDYQESWQPCEIRPELLNIAQGIAEKVTRSLGGAGLWGVEFFIGKNQVWFSELSPRPHDTGMVTLANTQNLNEFELHARAVLGLPIPSIELLQSGASAVVLASQEGSSPTYEGIDQACKNQNVDVRIFGKPTTRSFRRMGVVVAHDQVGSDINQVRSIAKNAAQKISVKVSK